jgi:hypothetical protein
LGNYLYAHVAATRQEAIANLRKTLTVNASNDQAKNELHQLQGAQNGLQPTPNHLPLGKGVVDGPQSSRFQAQKSPKKIQK